MTEIELLLQQQLKELQQQRCQEIKSLERQLSTLLQQQQEQQELLGDLSMIIAEQTQRCDVLHSAITEQAKNYQNLQTVVETALTASNQLDVEQLFSSTSNNAILELEVHQQKTDGALRQLENWLNALQNSVDALVAQLKR